MAAILGVDYGSRATYAAYIEDDRAVMVTSNTGQGAFSSIVQLNTDGPTLYPLDAPNADENACVMGLMRLLGYTYQEVQMHTTTASWSPYLTKGVCGKAFLRVGPKNIDPVDLVALTLSAVKSAAEAQLKQTVEDVVLTIAPHSTDAQRMALREAGIRAGLRVLRIVNLPTAVAFSHNFGHSSDTTRCFVWHGGHELACLSLMEAEYEVFELLDTQHLYDWQAALPATSPQAKEAAFAVLLERLVAQFQMEPPLAHKTGPKTPLLLSGGLSHEPWLQECLETTLNARILRKHPPEHTAVIGAATIAELLSHPMPDFSSLEVTALSLGIALHHDLFAPIIPRHTTIPTTAHIVVAWPQGMPHPPCLQFLAGERTQSSKNLPFYRLALDSLPSAIEGFNLLKVTLDIDANSLLTVMVHDLTTGTLLIRENISYQFSLDAVEQAIQDAERANKEDAYFQGEALRKTRQTGLAVWERISAVTQSPKSP